jgi:hypothetical protein
MIFGIIYLAVGILGFVPGLSSTMPDAGMDGMSLLLGIFPINPLHNIVHILVGIVGIAVARNAANAQTYFKALAVVYGLLTVLGLIPATSTVFGLVPIGSWDIALHGATAVVAAYFGWSQQPATARNA